jgi:hypothetical protein
LPPIYLQRDDHATGLIRLLSVGLRVLTLLEFVVRRGLAVAQTTLAGLYVGNPKRAMARPTTERLLKRFEGADPDAHPGGASATVSSDGPVACAMAYSGAPSLPCRHLYEALSRFLQTAIKMSEP